VKADVSGSVSEVFGESVRTIDQSNNFNLHVADVAPGEIQFGYRSFKVNLKMVFLLSSGPETNNYRKYSQLALTSSDPSSCSDYNHYLIDALPEYVSPSLLLREYMNKNEGVEYDSIVLPKQVLLFQQVQTMVSHSETDCSGSKTFTIQSKLKGVNKKTGVYNEEGAHNKRFVLYKRKQ
jgi:hypothetical protein